MHRVGFDAREPKWPAGNRPGLLVSVTPDRFDGTSSESFFRQLPFFVRLRLFKDIRVPTIFIPLEIRRRGFTAQIAVDALIIDVESAFSVLRITVFLVGHGIG